MGGRAKIFVFAFRLYPRSNTRSGKVIDLIERDFGCPLFAVNSIDGERGEHGYDARIRKIDKQIIDVSWGLYEVLFLDSASAMKRFSVGSLAVMWEMGDIGEGVVVQTPLQSSDTSDGEAIS